MAFPCVIGAETLSRQDFYRFELQFSKSVLDFFPCQTVQFITEGLATDEEPAATLPAGPFARESAAVDDALSAGWRTGLALVRQGRKPVVDAEGQTLFLPIWSNGDLLAVAALSGGGHDLFSRYSEEWLIERCRLLTREFALLKFWAQDPASGVLSLNHLRLELSLLLRLAEQSPSAAPCQLLLVEVAMRAQDAGQAMGNISRVAAYLESLVGGQAPVHHLGAGVFALIWHGGDLDEAQKLGYTLLRKLKRQAAMKVHIAIAALEVSDRQQGDSAEVTAAADGSSARRADRLLDKAWEALHTARQRGTFAMSVASASQADQHLLAPLAPEALGQLKRLWQGENQFSIIFLQKDVADQQEFPGRVRALIGEGTAPLLLDAHRAIIYLPRLDEQAASDWACAFANRILPLGAGTFSMGIASYPCPGFHKADIPLNAKKALVHTQFFGAGSTTSFSGVSLNISGDVYYNEGDLVSAIREYRLGLNLSPDNVNLLNSLGVIYAQIDSHAKAIPLFERAIILHPGDFMALFNLGFACLCHGEADKALGYFEQAEKIDGSYFDLLLQLGQLYCQRGQYKKAVSVLSKAEKAVKAQPAGAGSKPWERCEPWHGDSQTLGHGLVYRYLGEAYKGIGKNREAMTYLQRAARFNSRDSEALSLLGELYALENQGLDIALTFCRQAVGIDGAKAPYWYRMAKVLACREEWEEAVEAVQHCLALQPKHIEALMLKATLHERLKQTQLARLTYEKVLRIDGTNARAVKALKKINQPRR